MEKMKDFSNLLLDRGKHFLYNVGRHRGGEPCGDQEASPSVGEVFCFNGQKYICTAVHVSKEDCPLLGGVGFWLAIYANLFSKITSTIN